MLDSFEIDDKGIDRRSRAAPSRFVPVIIIHA